MTKVTPGSRTHEASVASATKPDTKPSVGHDSRHDEALDNKLSASLRADRLPLDERGDRVLDGLERTQSRLGQVQAAAERTNDAISVARRLSEDGVALPADPLSGLRDRAEGMAQKPLDALSSDPLPGLRDRAEGMAQKHLDSQSSDPLAKLDAARIDTTLPTVDPAAMAQDAAVGAATDAVGEEGVGGVRKLAAGDVAGGAKDVALAAADFTPAGAAVRGAVEGGEKIAKGDVLGGIGDVAKGAFKSTPVGAAVDGVKESVDKFKSGDVLGGVGKLFGGGAKAVPGGQAVAKAAEVGEAAVDTAKMAHETVQTVQDIGQKPPADEGPVDLGALAEEGVDRGVDRATGAMEPGPLPRAAQPRGPVAPTTADRRDHEPEAARRSGTVPERA